MKATSILALCALILSVGWGIVRDIRQPKENSVVSYEQLQDKETEVVYLMGMLTDSLPKPKNKRLITKSNISSLYYVYENPSRTFEKDLENNIRVNSNWNEFSVTKVDDISAFRSYCYKDISLVLLKGKGGVIDEYKRFTINVAWEKNSYCWQQANNKV